MRIALFFFTAKGKELTKRLSLLLNSSTFRQSNISTFIYDSKEQVQEAFKDCDALVFVSACGIAVRLIAPFVQDKLQDPAVIVIDENCNFVIPVLSGHVGGANELARLIANGMDSVACITTATDVNGMIAFDEFAVNNGLTIKNRENIKKVSAALLSKRPVNVALSDDIVISESEDDIDDTVLGMIYKPIVVGMGCRKDKPFEELREYFDATLETLSIDVKDVVAIASIDIKKEEDGLVKLANYYKIPFKTFSAEALNLVDGDFDESDFVKQKVGVSDVSARAAKACGMRGKFILKKDKKDGMTISVFEKYRRITFNYEQT